MNAFSGCLFPHQEESNVDFLKYPSSSLPDLVSTCSSQDTDLFPLGAKQRMDPDVEDVQASSPRQLARKPVCLIHPPSDVPISDLHARTGSIPQLLGERQSLTSCCPDRSPSLIHMFWNILSSAQSCLFMECY